MVTAKVNSPFTLFGSRFCSILRGSEFRSYLPRGRVACEVAQASALLLRACDSGRQDLDFSVSRRGLLAGRTCF